MIFTWSIFFIIIIHVDLNDIIARGCKFRPSFKCNLISLRETSMLNDYFKILLAYLAAGSVVFILGFSINHWNPIWVVSIADLVGTLVIFGFSVYHNNSSVYDPYWSVAPILISAYWFGSNTLPNEVTLRQFAVLGLVLVWALRLTLNWAVRWHGVRHEDWRYQEIRLQHPKTYWVISFFGIHLMPTILVFLGCLSLIPILVEPSKAFHSIDIIAFLVTIAAIWIETQADLEITRAIKNWGNTRQLVRSGVWGWSRHPNYFGEILFWWGLYAFALAANPRYWWVGIGPVAITLLFITISIPMIEKRMVLRKPGYLKYQNSTPVLVPWPFKTKSDPSNQD